MGENIFKPAGSYSKEDLIKCSEGKLFNPSDGKLPNNEMLMMDRITEVDLKKGAFEKKGKNLRQFVNIESQT